MIEVEIPGVGTIEFPDGTPPETIKAVAAKAAKGTNLVEQVGTGTSEGIANMAGLPVDAMTGALNWAGDKTGLWGPIEEPFGGSESIEGLLDPFMADMPPQTRAQRIGRRVGQEVGATTVGAPVAGARSAGDFILNSASALGSGLAGGGMSELTDDPIANVVASLIGGALPVAGSFDLRSGPQAPSNARLKGVEDALWEKVKESEFRLSPRQAEEMKGAVSANAIDQRMNETLHPKGPGAVDEVYGLSQSPSLDEVAETRKAVNRAIPPGFDAVDEARVIKGVGRTIDNEMDEVAAAAKPSYRLENGVPVMTSDGGRGDIETWRDARDVSRQRMASEKLDRTLDRAERQAARSHNGGNVVNSQRQRIDAILNSPKESSVFKPNELEQMDEIVRGTRGTNAARLLGSISPVRGGAYAGGNLGMIGAAAGFSGGNPIVTGLAATPGIISAVARQIGETLTDRQIEKLSATIRNGGVPVSEKALTAGERAVLSTLLASQAANQTE
jgi:hypothetical protein